MTIKKLTPMIEQWHECKKKAGDSVLLFRMGDFYEAFYDDAELLSQYLDLTLTQRQGVPMSGVPVVAIDNYVDRLVSKGFKVAIAEQFDDPKNKEIKKPGPITRDLQRCITPGTLLSSTLLHEKTNNYIVGINRVGSLFGFACLDLSTGSFLIEEHENIKELTDQICRLRPTEILASSKFYNKQTTLVQQLQQHLKLTLSTYADWAFEHQFASKKLTAHFHVASLDGFGLKGLVPGINAAGGLLSYIQDKLLLPTQHIAVPKTSAKQQRLLIDTASQINLELLAPLQDLQGKSSLLHVMDHTCTPMGGRLLRQTLVSPFYEQDDILIRQDAVEFLLNHTKLRKNIKTYLCQVRDVERLLTKITTGLAGPKDVGMLRDSLSASVQVYNQFADFSLPSFFQGKFILSAEVSLLITLLSQALQAELPLRPSEGNIFMDDFHKELQRLRYTREHSQEWVWKYQEDIREQTGIKKLKVCFAQALGYYIEVHSEFAPQLPKSFIRRQSRLHAERFTTAELQEFQDDMFNISEKLQALETQLFKDLCSHISQQRTAIVNLSQTLADTDYILSLAELADIHGYCRPRVDNTDILWISCGCHPVVQTLLGTGKFIPNDIAMQGSQIRMILLTGPNMAGKSTYIRQIALLVIMAQMGSFIPAKQAHIGIVDKIFTRIGAADNLAKGMSTFMVEMSETANILHNVTDRSLVILDEVGRGTSTYDGLAIAQAVVEYLLFTEGKKAKTLFATHYRELIDLEKLCSHVANFHAGVKEHSGQPIFLYEILKGYSQKSFGIHVARIAGFPLCVISRAQQILRQLEGPELAVRSIHNKMQQLTLF
ncbi:DNA mismatch repair protein MutS [Candidatus Chlamydia sanziniae]|uniref:DNA mismatch repair protein MutS n=1 Tax=Candidatus Chlamydia sanziniae TaxID=1806891 RepID=A0A1A9HXG9_9CHLA|nr:DNA mismatch repair protein MutS [Candidatus Chlamydia sanziniae]ANH78734.1 DNA mismatch repair protein MutS [Candidatus Chlamydia sanziniae]